jgi:tRNA-2-methylthio-N6-dimethylallyladenosine synthase
MGGFPGETEQQFQETMRLIDDLVFDYTEVYVFSARLNTAAADMKDQVPVPVRRHRRNQLWRKSLLAHTPQRLRKLRNSNI